MVTFVDLGTNFASVHVAKKLVGAICYGSLGFKAVKQEDAEKVVGAAGGKAFPETFPILYLESGEIHNPE